MATSSLLPRARVTTILALDIAPPGKREGWVRVFIQRVRDLAKDFTGENVTTTVSIEPGWDTFHAPDGNHVGDAWET